LKKLAFLVGVAATQAHAADHLDSTTLATNPMGDINDVYAWMTGNNLNLAMTVSPFDDGTRSFGPTVLYVFHVVSKPDLGFGKPGTETKVICKLASSTAGECWVTDASGTKDYVMGDPSATTGVTSGSGKVRLFAGRRSDPFFFNFQAFNAVIGAVDGAKATFTFDGAGCPNNVQNATTQTLRMTLKTPMAPAGPCATTGSATTGDCFANANVMAVVVQLDKSLVNTGSNTTVSVWGSTHVGTP
jgi:uncharacterized protein DUF4331